MNRHWTDDEPYGLEHRLFPVLLIAFALAAATTLTGPRAATPDLRSATSQAVVRSADYPLVGEDMVRMEVVDVVEPEGGSTHVVLLMDRQSEYVLPIFLPAAEAEVLRTGLVTEDGNPSTQVLLGEAIRGLGGEILRVEVDLPANEPARAWVVVARDDAEFTLQARPGDALTLALEGRSPIVASRALIRERGIHRDRVKHAPAEIPSGLRSPRNL